MHIREELSTDREVIYSLIKNAFAHAEHSDGNEQELVNALRQGEAFIPELSLVCEVDGVIVGHILFTKARIENNTVLALAPLSVLPEYQGRGIGTLLMQEGHRIARELGYSYSVVLGDPQYYSRIGYVPADDYGIYAPFDVPRELFRAFRLDDQAPSLNGKLVYAAEFGI